VILTVASSISFFQPLLFHYILQTSRKPMISSTINGAFLTDFSVLDSARSSRKSVSKAAPQQQSISF